MQVCEFDCHHRLTDSNQLVKDEKNLRLIVPKKPFARPKDYQKGRMLWLFGKWSPFFGTRPYYWQGFGVWIPSARRWRGTLQSLQGPKKQERVSRRSNYCWFVFSLSKEPSTKSLYIKAKRSVDSFIKRFLKNFEERPLVWDQTSK